MPRHIPDLAALRALPNHEVRFYATVGAAISLAAALELTFIDIFHAATGLDRALAAKIMYQNRNASYRRDAADAAMRHKLRSDTRLQSWEALAKRIVAATGNSGARNLVGHTTVSHHVIEGHLLGGAPLGAAPLGGSVVLGEHFYVEQDADRILAGIEKPRSEDFNSLIAYCNELIDLLSSVDAFLAQI